VKKKKKNHRHLDPSLGGGGTWTSSNKNSCHKLPGCLLCSGLAGKQAGRGRDVEGWKSTPASYLDTIWFGPIEDSSGPPSGAEAATHVIDAWRKSSAGPWRRGDVQANNGPRYLVRRTPSTRKKLDDGKFQDSAPRWARELTSAEPAQARSGSDPEKDRFWPTSPCKPCERIHRALDTTTSVSCPALTEGGDGQTRANERNTAAPRAERCAERCVCVCVDNGGLRTYAGRLPQAIAEDDKFSQSGDRERPRAWDGMPRLVTAESAKAQLAAARIPTEQTKPQSQQIPGARCKRRQECGACSGRAGRGTGASTTFACLRACRLRLAACGWQLAACSLPAACCIGGEAFGLQFHLMRSARRAVPADGIVPARR
jgi:hypothetical protein